MRRFAVAASMLLMIFAVGCGQEPAVIRSKDADLSMFRELTLKFCGQAKQNPATAQGALETLVENLNESSRMELGNQKETIESLKVLCHELTQMYGRSAPAAEITTKIEELSKLAQTLPGEELDTDMKPSRPSDDI